MRLFRVLFRRLTIVIAAVAACIVPLRRATSVDPAIALRCE